MTSTPNGLRPRGPGLTISDMKLSPLPVRRPGLEVLVDTAEELAAPEPAAQPATLDEVLDWLSRLES